MLRNLNDEISKTFYTTPRDGYKKGNLWIKRKEETKLSALLDNLGVSICIDGPTGTGKSSLAITVLKQKKIDYILIQVTKSMTWKTFCRMLLHKKTNDDNAIDLSFEAGIEKGVPIFKLHFGITSTQNSKDDLTYEDKIIEQMTDHTICEILHKRKVALLIDDFERASDEILTNIGDMCKLLTESYISDKNKLVIVGTDDIYYRLTKFNKSLEGRLKELSIGTIDNKNDSWDFLTQGFDKLNLKHPEYELKHKFPSISFEDIKTCREASYDAADGLLKSLNELGNEIARQATVNRRISKATIIEISKSYLERNIKRFNREYPKIFKSISQNTVVKNLVIHLYKKDIGKIHNWTDISYHMSQLHLHHEQIEDAICQLVEIEFLTRTGYDGEVLFVTNPTLAHTIWAVINNPNKYDVPRSFITDNKQIALPFLQKEENTG